MDDLSRPFPYVLVFGLNHQLLSLEARLAGGGAPLLAADRLAVGAGVAAALFHLHALHARVVHRAVCAANVWLSEENGRVIPILGDSSQVGGGLYYTNSHLIGSSKSLYNKALILGVCIIKLPIKLLIFSLQ